MFKLFKKKESKIDYRTRAKDVMKRHEELMVECLKEDGYIVIREKDLPKFLWHEAMRFAKDHEMTELIEYLNKNR